MQSFIQQHAGRIGIAIFGLLIIIFQLFLPDFVPDAIKQTISASPEQHGYNFLLNAILSLWQIGGIGLFLGGIISMFF
jgi:hypothetical protein